MPANPKEDVVVYLDKNDKATTKDKATQVRILTTDEQGNRLEVYGVMEPKP